MSLIAVQYSNEKYILTEDGEWACAHEDAYVEKACCPPGTNDCGCRGMDSMVCPNDNCTGISEREAEEFFEGHYERLAYHDCE